MRFKVFLFSIMAGLLSSCQTQEPLVLATYTYADNTRVANLQPLSDNYSAILGRSVETVSYPDVMSLMDGIKKGEVDIAFINSFGYLLLEPENHGMRPVAALNVGKDVKDNYKTVLLASRASGIKTLDTLKKNAHALRLMLVNQGSTSGNLVPRLFLSALDLRTPESQFKSVRYGGNHTATFEKLLRGETDLCALGSNEYFKQVQNDATIPDRTHMLWISSEIPLGPVLVKESLSESEKEKITQVLLNLHQSDPNILDSIKRGWSEAQGSERFVPFAESHYDNFRNFNGNPADLTNILKFFNPVDAGKKNP